MLKKMMRKILNKSKEIKRNSNKTKINKRTRIINKIQIINLSKI